MSTAAAAATPSPSFRRKHLSSSPPTPYLSNHHSASPKRHLGGHQLAPGTSAAAVKLKPTVAVAPDYKTRNSCGDKTSSHQVGACGEGGGGGGANSNVQHHQVNESSSSTDQGNVNGSAPVTANESTESLTKSTPNPLFPSPSDAPPCNLLPSQLLQLPIHRPLPPNGPEENDRRVKLAQACEGLSSLCSQWHQSEYNVMKHGVLGAPVHYCPISIMAPDHIFKIMHAQAIYEAKVASLDDDISLVAHHTGQLDDTKESKTQTAEGDASFGNDRRACEEEKPDRKESAKFAPSLQATPPAPPPSLESSQSQSQMRCTTNDGSSNVLASQSLAEEEGYEGMAVKDMQSDCVQLNDGTSVAMDTTATQEATIGSQDEQRMRSELKLAMDDDLMKPYDSMDAIQQPLEPEARTKQCVVKTSHTHPINVSLLLPNEAMPLFVKHLSSLGSPSPLSASMTSSSISTPSCSSDVPSSSTTTTHQPSRPPFLYPSSDKVWSAAVHHAQLGGNAPVPMAAMPSQPVHHAGIGNLFLSSCPGKKVRLDGPVNGRSTICRDLTLDLSRIKDMGVGCIVCCLDDNELCLLGTPWEQYRSKAKELGLAVVRIPMPEGLTPASMTLFDKHVECIIRNYTLRGIHTLAHCRAGVGRAGLTACAWAVKLGIAGPLPDLEVQIRQLLLNQEQQQQQQQQKHVTGANGQLQEDDDAADQQVDMSHELCENARVMSTVERVIALIRRRRSVKAIETFEQVNFLVSYVAWLRRESGMARSDTEKCLASA